MLESLQEETTEMQHSEKDDGKAVKIRLSYAKNQASIYKKTYQAAEMDVERLCPGTTFALATEFESLDRKSAAQRFQQLTDGQNSVRREEEETRVWMFSCLMTQTKQGQKRKVFFDIDELQGRLTYSEAERTGF